VMREFTMGVRSCLSRQQYHGDVEFYGFSKERGFVSNMKVYGWDTMNNALWIDGRLSIGLPYDFRTDMDWFDDDKYNVYDAIETVLANRQDRSIRDEDEDEEEF